MNIIDDAVEQLSNVKSLEEAMPLFHATVLAALNAILDEQIELWKKLDAIENRLKGGPDHA